MLEKTNKRRNPYVDFLRGISIIAVLLLHFTLAFGLKNSLFANVLGRDSAKALLFNGNYGVTIFFVISGYLITGMSILRWGSVGGIDPLTFYVYRFARIIPSLVLVLAIIVPLGSIGVPYFSNTDDGHHLPASYFIIAISSILTFWHNVLMQSEGWFNYCLNIYWSLSVEEVFYISLPILCILFRRTWLFVFACVVLIVYAPFYRAVHLDNGLYWECGYGACFDSIALGCLTALLARKWSPSGSRALTLRVMTMIGMGIFYLRGIDGHEVFGFTGISFCAAGFLFASSGVSDQQSLALHLTRPIQWLGQHSYELYLFHIVVLALMRNVFSRGSLQPLAWGLWLILFAFLSITTAAIVARYVSEPANKSIRRLFSAWSQGGGMMRPKAARITG